MTSVPRTSLVNNAVSFLRDPKTQEAPLDKRVEFLRSKGLTNEEMDDAFRQVGMAPTNMTASSSVPATDSDTGSGFFPVPIQASQSYNAPAYQPQYAPTQYPYPPPLLHQPSEQDRDWRDWFIMAVVSGTAMIGIYSLARKYLFPQLVPPPLTAFQQSQQDLQSQFDAIQKQLDEMAQQTENQTKTVEAQRDEVTRVVEEVERALQEMETEGEKAKDELKEIRQEVKNIRDLVPKLIETSQAAATTTLTEVQQELRSLKQLLITRPQHQTPFSPTTNPTSSSYLPFGVGASPGGTGAQSPLLTGRPAIPAWQLASRPSSTTPQAKQPQLAKADADVSVKGQEKEGTAEDLGASGVLVHGEDDKGTDGTSSPLQ